MRIRSVIVAAVFIGAAQASPALAQPQSATATMTVSVSTSAKLTISSSTLTFADANPDLVPQIAPAQGALSITAKARATDNAQVVLTVQADDDLRSGLQVSPASAITWTASGTGFASGTLSKTAPVTLGQWTGSGSRTGSQTLAFRNLWTYATGTYTCVLLYTLSGP
jgi:hypothetical protein